MESTVGGRAYNLLRAAAVETSSARGLEALLNLLDKFDGVGGLTGASDETKQSVRSAVLQRLKAATD